VFYTLTPITLNTNYTPPDRQESRMERNEKNIYRHKIYYLPFSALHRTIALYKLQSFDVQLFSKYMWCGIKHFREMYHKHMSCISKHNNLNR
jgi:hypothetical protein